VPLQSSVNTTAVVRVKAAAGAPVANLIGALFRAIASVFGFGLRDFVIGIDREEMEIRILVPIAIDHD
jgi:hypothetical protein